MADPIAVTVYVYEAGREYEVTCTVTWGRPQRSASHDSRWVPGDEDPEVEVILVRDGLGAVPEPMASHIEREHAEEIAEMAIVAAAGMQEPDEPSFFFETDEDGIAP
jgi:hypothetical protein